MSPQRRGIFIALAAFIVVGLGYVLVDKFGLSKPVDGQKAQVEAAAASPAKADAALAITDKSVAVLPFVDMSEKKDQEYMADGIAEELLNLLARVPDLRVIARTSSFAFKGQNLEIAEIARKLNVAHVLAKQRAQGPAGTLRISASSSAPPTVRTCGRKPTIGRSTTFQGAGQIAIPSCRRCRSGLQVESEPQERWDPESEAFQLYLRATGARIKTQLRIRRGDPRSG
jgi:TolB-like protein